MLGLWYSANLTGMANPLFLPSIRSVGASLLKQLSTRAIYSDVLATTYRAMAGLMLSVLFAVPLGMFFGRAPRLYEFIELPVDFFRSIPSSALFFLFILLFGIGDKSKIAVVFYGCALVLLVSTVYGARATKEKQDRINMLRSFGATKVQVYYFAVLRDALPNITAGLRVCASLSFVLVVVTEMFLSATTGLGCRIYDFYLAYRVPEMYASIIVLGVLGFIVNRGFGEIERRICFWLPS